MTLFPPPLTAPLQEVLYVSTLAPGQPLGIVAAIAAKARLSNVRDGITGLLVFDGQRFCQQLEGPPAPLASLLGRIRVDARHTEMEVLHQAPLMKRRFQRFSLAFSTLEDADALPRMESLAGDDAMAAFKALAIDLEL
ncbi:BLUF domain-containing protein [Paracidovorax cattleyae]|uniref:Sensors of blue-light using FAD n=1 Tax=Paracidovorax cattleyae TaxID=80868 RepID=A0A1H0N679_9BURK|nr:BLUF domain-containing protein [Paracidovorax cattleyae]AVS75583.1 blue light sensor protein [Paracidovorax cattleyae]MBF9266995.1 BLUF domain-containing protein [Paracidovorax cattleyae]SDO88131.1 Sensors of blue-light using FAD [Paracidovorax cattleyae]